MKKLLIPAFALLLLSSCDKKETVKADTTIVWADSLQTLIPLETDTLRDDADLTNAEARMSKEKIFNSLLSAVLNGKMKAYKDYPGTALSTDDIKHILVKWDTTQVEDPNNPGVFVSAVMKTEITAEWISQIRFHESIVFDTVTASFERKIKFLTLYSYKRNEEGNVLGLLKLFDVVPGDADKKEPKP